ncbi:MAG: hypothetical protein MJE66_18950 [Proteobacteria bacterium]|nr:hypothetical protein [Pseudomonadota bacterium]
MRFERDQGAGFERVFPETFSFHPERHDPAELYLQLEDLLRRPRLLSPKANRRDAQELVLRLLPLVPRYLEELVNRLEAEGRLSGSFRARVHQDVALLGQIVFRFLQRDQIESRRSVRVAGHHLRKLIFRSLDVVVRERVDSDYLERYVGRRVNPVDLSDDPTESGYLHAMEGDDAELVNRTSVRMAEWAFFQWLEGVCLDEENQAFEKEDSPFEDREREVLHAVHASGGDRIEREADLCIFLRRPGRDASRVLGKLERWFLRQYDIPNSSAVIQHAARVDGGVDAGDRLLSRNNMRTYLAIYAAILAPLAAAAFFYAEYPRIFDWFAVGLVFAVNAGAVWFLGYRFCWKRDLTFFYASVPRIGAGVIVGYLPVFLIDEVWDLAGRSLGIVLSVSVLLALTTLLYVYLEVQRRLGDATVAFSRARALFLMGTLQSMSVGLLVTNLVGGIMVSRNWSPGDQQLPVEVLRGELAPLVGELPPILGIEPFYVYPSAVFMMMFLAFFIGIFLQLLWEDLPVTEPL